MENPALEPMSVVELSEVRWRLLRMLDGIEHQRDPACRESLCRRIQRLCRDGIIPEPIGDLMHLVRRCRNRAEYEDHFPEGMESRAVRFAWAAIEDWWLRRTRVA